MSLKHKVNFLLFFFPQPTIPTDPPVVYHATVIAAQKFVEEDDVNQLQKYLGKNSDSGLKSRIAFSILAHNVLMYGNKLQSS